MSVVNNDKTEIGYSPTLIITTILVFLVVCMLGVMLFVMRSREQGRWMTRAQALRAQEWVRKMDELGMGIGTPALYEVVVGSATKAHPWAGDLTKCNETTWKDIMVCRLHGIAGEILNECPWVHCLASPCPRLVISIRERQITVRFK